MFGLFKNRKPPREFPPRPLWRPTIVQPLDRIIERVRYYYGEQHDFVVFQHGTCAIATEHLNDEELQAYGKDVLSKIFSYHPDFDPMEMEDGNVLVRYNHPAVNVVLADVAAEHWASIDKLHLDALATHEVLMTPLGPNVFDGFGKKALFGRCYMFMDALAPQPVRIERRDA